ncbi:hypothetical protein VNI00_018042 [Paramarasmius palmivorus]|uniref:Uncharacterized protein n=1 Tax=Paramarasmius palmivorus TaxID=297713 RepID=A0AAW0B1C1_9AGAR
MAEYQTSSSTLTSAILRFRCGGIARFLSPFFPNPGGLNQLRSSLSSTGALIGGKAVLGLFTESTKVTEIREKVLEIYSLPEPSNTIMRTLRQDGFVSALADRDPSWSTHLLESISRGDNFDDARCPEKTLHTPTVNDHLYVVDVFKFVNKQEREVHVVISRLHPAEVILAMKTSGRNLVSNPVLTAADVMDISSERAVITRNFGDLRTLTLKLTPCDLHTGDSALGDPFFLMSQSWRPHYSFQSSPMILSTFLYDRSLRQTYFLSPHAYDAIYDRPLRNPGNVEDRGALSVGNSEDRDKNLQLILADVYAQLSDSDSPCCRIAEKIGRSMKDWPHRVRGLGNLTVPWCATACVVFDALYSVSAVREGTAQFELELNRPLSPNEEANAKLIVTLGEEYKDDGIPTRVRTDLEAAGVRLETKTPPPPLIPATLPTENALCQALGGLLKSEWTDECTAAMDVLDEEGSMIVDEVVGVMLAKGYVTRFVESHYQRGVYNPKAVSAVPTLAIVCPRCDIPVNLPPPDQRWYAIFSGLRVGWLQGWENVKQLVLHVPENKYTAYSTREDARKAFVMALAARAVVIQGGVDHAMVYDAVPANIGWVFP